MKPPISALRHLAVVLTSALALGSCSRAEYAFLPRSASYLGTTPAGPKTRVAPTPAPITQAPTAAPEITVATTLAPVAAKATAPVAARPAPTPLASTEAVAPAPTTPATSAAPRKLSLVQRLALAKVTKKLNKLVAKTPQLKQGDNTAHTTRIDGNLRTGIILLLIGLLIGILNATIGTIIAIIGLIFIVLWLLDSL